MRRSIVPLCAALSLAAGATLSAQRRPSTPSRSRSMTESHEPVKLASFATAFEAERAVATLENAGIPVMVKSHGGSIVFGAGPVPGGVELFVRKRDVDRAWTLVVQEMV